MIAFEISINGQPYCESEDVTVLTMVVEEVRRGKGERVSLHARGSDESSLQWLAANLSIGDEVSVRIVDAEERHGPDPSCSFCGRGVVDVPGLVVGGSAAICERCAGELGLAVKNGSSLPAGATIRGESEWTCGFCAKQPGDIPGVVVRNGAAICPECLRACSDILTEDSRSSPSGRL